MNISVPSFFELPSDLHGAIFSFLDPVSLKQIASTNTLFNRNARVNSLWKRLLNLIYPSVRHKIDVSDPQAYYKAFLAKKRMELCKIKKPFIRKLSVLVEETNIEAIKKLLQTSDEKITSILHTENPEKNLINLISEQNHQGLKDLFFQLVHAEYTHPETLQDIALTDRRQVLVYLRDERAIIKQPTDPLKKHDINGYTLFDWACIFGQRTFLNRPEIQTINPNRCRKIEPYYSSLSIAILAESLEGVQYLIERGARVSWSEYDLDRRDSAIFLAARSQLPIFTLLLSHPDVWSLPPEVYSSSLNRAAFKGRTENVKYLIENYRVLLSPEDIKKATFTAARQSRLTTLEFLYPISKQFDLQANDLLKELNFFDPFGDPIGCLIFLLEEKADVNTLRKCWIGNETLLHFAIGRKNIELAEILLTRGANTEIDCSNYTPMRLAIFKDNNEMVRLLIDHGAIINQDHMDFAKIRQCAEIIEMLTEAQERGRGLKRARDVKDTLDVTLID